MRKAPTDLETTKMARLERYAITVGGLDGGLDVADRLASCCGATLRWAAVWTDEPSRFEGSWPRLAWADADVTVVYLENPTRASVRELAARADRDACCVHWSARTYTSDEGEDARWIAFEDTRGFRRDDARVYRIELAWNARPLTAPDRPWQDDFPLGPELAAGWRLHVAVVRDHMPRERLVAWLAEAAEVPTHTLAPSDR